RQHRHPAASCEIITKKNPQLQGLIGEKDGRRNRKTEAQTVHSRAASHSRIACASRRVMSGNSLSEPTSGEILHDRAHFVPSASCGSTATPFTSSRRNAPAGAAPVPILAADVINTSARSTPFNAAR